LVIVLVEDVYLVMFYVGLVIGCVLSWLSALYRLFVLIDSNKKTHYYYCGCGNAYSTCYVIVCVLTKSIVIVSLSQGKEPTMCLFACDS